MVIGIDLEDEAFEQDVRELLMAFYPGAGFVYEEKLSDADILVTGRFLNSNGAESGMYILDVQKAENNDALEGGDDKDNTSGEDKMDKGSGAGRIPGEPDAGREQSRDWREVFFWVSPVIRRGLAEAEENLPFAVNRSERKEMKNRIKRRLYFLLMLETKKELPWGALTGIRPVKIPEEKLSLGWNDERILGFLEEDYLVGEKKKIGRAHV